MTLESQVNTFASLKCYTEVVRLKVKEAVHHIIIQRPAFQENFVAFDPVLKNSVEFDSKIGLLDLEGILDEEAYCIQSFLQRAARRELDLVENSDTGGFLCLMYRNGAGRSGGSVWSYRSDLSQQVKPK
ncbi:unnamed protein product [Dibothriocephalus latus]|uniref:Uncharacterized protein n=1 Tax=Dibothriocephalus latus TaxID=60516 RepID=A0A3P7NQS4_DIBLA|nr:unnamed protein product [Dibothriocephalus latus]